MTTTTISRRYEFVYLFDITNGNPNGDPDAGNLPRLDPETNCGLVTDVCLKRKIRNFVALEKEDATGYAIYMQEKAILNQQHEKAWEAVGLKQESKDAYKKLPKEEGKSREITDWMCSNFFDVRTFGAVMTTGVNAGQVRGPVQMAFATSIDPVVPLEISITRMAATNEAEKKQKAEGDDSSERTDNRTMGRKHIVPYGLYVAHGFISAKFAERTGFSEGDLSLLFEALATMFEHDRSAARGEMATRKLVAFKHDNALGNAPAHALFERIRIGRNVDGEFRVIDQRLDNLPPARAFSDYIVAIDRDGLPEGVEILELL